MNVNGYEIAANANLRGANLRGADLQEADLQEANLRGADLQEADLQEADLQGADLQGANLRGADLRGADLQWANLRGADLRGADLQRADLRGADLQEADLQSARDIPPVIAAKLTIVPEGELIVYKKLQGDKICKLKIPVEAKRSNATGRKCRAEYAIVLDGEGESFYDKTFKYRVGETVKPTEPFDDDRWGDCASGIHFFLTREEAETY